VVPGQRTAQKAVAVPEQMVQTRNKSRKCVLTWFACRCRKRQPKRAKRPHSKFSRRKALNGPAMRPQLRLLWRMASGSWQPREGAPNVSVGKRAWRTPSPQFASVQSQDWTGAFCLHFPFLILLLIVILIVILILIFYRNVKPI